MKKWQHGPAVERFWTYVQKTEGCWLWTGAIWDGYGVLQTGTKERHQNTRAHRMSWLIHRGPIPKGLLVLHTCDVRNCVNPDHLFLGTAQDNARDMVSKARHGRGYLARAGEANPSARLTAADIPHIRELAGQGMTMTAIGRLFGISRQRISLILAGRAWNT